MTKLRIDFSISLFFCYIFILCFSQVNDDSFYIGQTDNFARRLKQQNNKEVSWTSTRLPVEPI
jgi:predicted GIY-YIG superfamily endonuclease